jgi:hypothetical protein
MVTLNDPYKFFAPLEVVERLLELRVAAGFKEFLSVNSTLELAYTFDAYGFGIYSFSAKDELIDYDGYCMKVVPYQ